MKKTLIALLTLALVFCGCGGSEETTAAAVETKAEQQAAEYVFEAKGVKVTLNAEADAIIKALGDDYSYFESESCAFKGLDKEYNYGSFVVLTYPVDGVDYILSVQLMDDTVETAEGIAIGTAKADVSAKLGTPAEETPKAFIYESGKTSLTVVFEDDSVTSIQYDAVTE